jgi:peptidoglycan/xylan/chitin deacetylase (PgdA/CDA1 family)
MSCRLNLSMRIAAALAALFAGASAAGATSCGPDKLGTSRVIQVGVEGGLEVGLKTYPQTIPLADHEVILTFDDGPAARTTPQILDALARECVRATFFEIGRNAEGLPAIARREVLDGDTVAYHTYSHPQQTLRFMPDADARADILKGMIAVEKAAYGQDFSGGAPKDLKDLKLHAPFFRFPGFADTEALRRWLAANNVGVFSADLWAGDWIKTTPQEELKAVMTRLNRLGRGILLLHDTHQWTADMVPMLLRELKAKGYRVVHMVPGPGHMATAPAPKGWFSVTERTIDALKPRLEKAAARKSGTPVLAGRARPR